jgi:hypothetical protein
MTELHRINGQDIDVDEQTSIGITFQTYDIKEPGKRKVTISNQFTIPKTAKNLKIIGFAGDPQFTSTVIYDSMYYEYWIDNEKLIDNARTRIDEVGDRISLFVFQKNDIWDDLKLFEWDDFVSEFIDWLYSEKSYPSELSYYSGNFSAFISQYISTTEGLIIPMFFGNLYEHDPAGDSVYLEDETTIWMKYWPDTESVQSDGGHICAYVKTIFEFIEYKYGVNLCVNEVGLTGNIWDDSYATAIYVPIRDLTVSFHFNGGSVDGVYFEKIATQNFTPYKNLQDKAGKTLYDLVNSFLQHFNIIKDNIEISGEPAIKLSRFDDIATMADIIDFSGGLQDTSKFKPFISGFNQKNYIKFSDIYPEGDELQNSRVIVCDNKNLDAQIDLFTIDAYINAVISITGGVVPDLSVKESFKTFNFFISDGLTTDTIDIYCSQNQAAPELAQYKLQKSALYSLSNEYLFIDSIVQYPRFYEIEKWLTLKDINNLIYFRKYYIQELNGSYFINKISGFNPKNSNKPTKLEIFKIGDDAVIDFKELIYYEDGIENIFTDGLGNNFF